jgi:hypothetical protein
MGIWHVKHVSAETTQWEITFAYPTPPIYGASSGGERKYIGGRNTKHLLRQSANA